MPHEQINYPDVAAIAIWQGQELAYGDWVSEQHADDTTVTPDLALHVSWERGSERGSDGHVQVSIQVPTPVVVARAGRIEGEDVTATAFYAPGLTRTEINHLIRTLRRARDAAFGSDE